MKNYDDVLLRDLMKDQYIYYVVDEDDNSLSHHGVLGMKWGVRKDRSSSGTNRTTEYPKILNSPPLNNKVKPRVNKVDNYDGKLYFISTEDLDGKTLEPRIPNNYFTENKFEDATNKRICFAPSIDKCLMGISQNLDGKQYNVYEPAIIPPVLYKPNAGAVPDSKLTDEIWCVTPITIKKVGSISVRDNGKPGQSFKYGDNKHAELFSWDYEFKNNSKHGLSHSEIAVSELYHHGVLGMKWGR